MEHRVPVFHSPDDYPLLYRRKGENSRGKETYRGTAGKTGGHGQQKQPEVICIDHSNICKYLINRFQGFRSSLKVIHLPRRLEKSISLLLSFSMLQQIGDVEVIESSHDQQSVIKNWLISAQSGFLLVSEGLDLKWLQMLETLWWSFSHSYSSNRAGQSRRRPMSKVSRVVQPAMVQACIFSQQWRQGCLLLGHSRFLFEFAQILRRLVALSAKKGRLFFGRRVELLIVFLSEALRRLSSCSLLLLLVQFLSRKSTSIDQLPHLLCLGLGMMLNLIQRLSIVFSFFLPTRSAVKPLISFHPRFYLLKVWLMLARTALSSSLLLKRKSFLRGQTVADWGLGEGRLIDIDKIIDLESDRIVE